MRKQENNLSHRARWEMLVGLTPGRQMLAVTAALLMGAGLVFSGRVSAHNISEEVAKAKVRRYVRKILDAPKSPYIRATTNCNKAFNGHNHYVRCTVTYKNQENESKGRGYACIEHIEVFFLSHNLLRGENNTYYMKHTSPECGGTRLVN